MRAYAPLLLFVPVLVLLLLATSCTTTVKYVCPPLSPVPISTLDALQVQSKRDPDTGRWVVDLSKHYQKCDTLR